MSNQILVPSLGESVTEATVSKWLKQVGEKVDSDEPLVELETDKVNVEVPSPLSGTLSSIKVKEGDKSRVTGGKRKKETPEYDDYEDAPNSDLCDISILRSDVERDIEKELWSSQNRFSCPKVKRVLCLRKRELREITCKVSILEDTEYLQTCDMSYVTRELSEEVGESFLSAQYKYACQLPRRMDCSVDDHNKVSCDLRRLHSERMLMFKHCIIDHFSCHQRRDNFYF